MKMYWGMEMQLYEFLTSALDGLFELHPGLM